MAEGGLASTREVEREEGRGAREQKRERKRKRKRKRLQELGLPSNVVGKLASSSPGIGTCAEFFALSELRMGQILDLPIGGVRKIVADVSRAIAPAPVTASRLLELDQDKAYVSTSLPLLDQTLTMLQDLLLLG